MRSAFKRGVPEGRVSVRPAADAGAGPAAAQGKAPVPVMGEAGGAGQEAGFFVDDQGVGPCLRRAAGVVAINDAWGSAACSWSQRCIYASGTALG